MAEPTAAVTTTVTCTCGKRTEEHLSQSNLVDRFICLPLAENCSCGSDCRCVGQQCAEGCCTCVCRGCDGSPCSCGDDCRCGNGCCEKAICKKCCKWDPGSNQMRGWLNLLIFLSSKLSVWPKLQVFWLWRQLLLSVYLHWLWWS